MSARFFIFVWLWTAVAFAKSPLHSFAQAHKQLDNWQLEDALLAAQEWLFEDPENPELLFLAARVQHARAEYHSARSLLLAAKKGGNDEAGSFLPLVENPLAYAQYAETLETPHFKIRYLDKDEIVASYAAEIVEAAYKNIGGDLQLLPAERGEKIAVEIYPDVRGLSGATGLTIKEIETSGTIAVCKFHRLMIVSPLATADGYDWADTLAHEFTHLVISKKSHNTIPIWLHEGIAKFYESRWKGAAGQALGAYSERLLEKAVKKKKFITYQQMHPSMAKLPSQDDAALAFAEVFTTIEFLVKEYGKDSVPKVLELSATGLALDDVLKKVFGQNLKGIETAWKNYLNKRSFHARPDARAPLIRLASEEGSGGVEKTLDTQKDSVVHNHARLGELLQLRGRLKAAVVEYEKAYTLSASRYPNLNYRLAKAYIETGQQNAALKIIDSSLKNDPDDGDLQLLMGRIYVDKRDFDKAQKNFEQARLQNPFNPEIHATLAQLYKNQGRTEQTQRENRFLELCRKMRPRRDYDTPALKSGEASVSLLSRTWKGVDLDGTTIATPILNWPLNAGAHSLTPLGPTSAKQNFSLQKNEHKVLIVPAATPP